jgi:hypothetical protein
MGSCDYLLLAGALAALAFGAVRLSRVVSYLILLIVAALPIYNVGSKYGMTLVTGVLGVLIFFAIYAGLYWVGGKLNRKPS